MISVNKRARSIVQRMIDDCEALGIRTMRLKNGTTVLDAGIQTVGSMEAGRLFACACLGGLGQVNFTQQLLENGDAGFWLPAVAVAVSHPHIACMASQYAGWAVKLDHYFAIGSGPARALYANEELFQKLAYRDQSETAILMLEGRAFPDEEVAELVAEKCRVKPERLFLLIAPTASVVGSIQIAARAAETGLHKLVELGFDVRRIVSASGLCPIAPVACDDMHAIGRTNDSIFYDGQVFYTARADDDELAALIEKIPSASSRDYGTQFYELFMRYKGDFFQIDPMIFSPASVEINNLNSGHTFCAGQINRSILEASLLEGIKD